MLTGFPLGVESNSRMARIFGMARWNPYVSNWPLVLEALRKLWEMGKVSELRSPFYESFEKPENK
jgi:hypothetical protein